MLNSQWAGGTANVITKAESTETVRVKLLTSVALAVLVALPPTIAATGALIVAMRQEKKTDEIHVMVNSNLTSVKADLAMANQRIEDLSKLLIGFQEDKAAAEAEKAEAATKAEEKARPKEPVKKPDKN